MSTVKHAQNPAYKSSTMKSVLTQYGMKDLRGAKPFPESKKPRRRVPSPEAKKYYEPAKKGKLFFEETIIIEDTADIVERKKEKDKRVLQMLNDMQRLRYYYYLEYKERLVDKVEKQREEAARLKEREQKMREKRDARNLREAHKLKKRVQRVPLQHDEDFLKHIPHTDYYRIIREEHRLLKEGKLRTQTAKEQFWNDRLHRPKDLELDDKHSDNLDGSSTVELRLSRNTEAGDQLPQLPRHLHPLPSANVADLDRISEGDERSRPSTKRTVHRGKSFTKKLEALFPKMELPPLHIFDMDLSETIDEEEERRLKAIEDRFRQRETRKAMYNRMFNLALTHNATAKRIIEDRMDETAQMIFQREFTNLGDLVADRSKLAVEPEEEEEEDGSKAPPRLPAAEEEEEGEEEEEEDDDEEKEEEEEQEEEEERERELTVDLPKTPQSRVIPLTLGELETSLPTMTPVKLSSMWTNYMKEPKRRPNILDELNEDSGRHEE